MNPAHIVIDFREQRAMNLILKSWPYKTEIRKLETGDYACSDGCCGFERKEDDFDINYFHQILTQIEEMKAAFANPYLVVCKPSLEAWIKQNHYPTRSKFIASLFARNMPPIFVGSRPNMLDIIRNTIQKNHDGKFRGIGEFSSVRRIKHSDQVLHVITSFPGCGGKKGRAIMDKFGNLDRFLRATKKEMCEVDGIGPKTADNILMILTKEMRDES